MYNPGEHDCLRHAYGRFRPGANLRITWAVTSFIHGYVMTELFIDRGAAFSDCMQYRYRLWRIWDADSKYAMFLMLNPSTADETKNDPTVERCQRYAMAWGYGGLHVCNIFALRSTDPAALYQAEDPVGVGNDIAIVDVATGAGIVVCAWGNHGAHLGRAGQVLQLLKGAGVTPHCLKVTGGGEPGHPLYLRKDLQPIQYNRSLFNGDVR